MTPRPGTANVSTHVLPRLAGFFEALRTGGLSVGIGSQLDLARALDHVSVLDRQAFLDACRATLVKSPEDLATLEAVFDNYWSPGSIATAEPAPRARARVSRPAADGRIEPTPRSITPIPIGTTRRIGIRVGVYSADAPPGGHVLRPIDPRRLIAMRAGARRLRKMIATLPGRRARPAHHGHVDLARTLRQAGRASGEWIDLRRAKPRLTRAELLILWDVSGSMRDHDADLAALVYSLRRTVRRSRVFAFSTETRELTGILEGEPYRASLGPLARALGPAGGGTRIGRCLRDFRRTFGRFVHPWTTVFVLSDGWDLGETDLLAREVAWLHGKAHRVVWVNPYARERGFRPDTAGMMGALPHVDSFLGPADFAARGGPGA